MWHGYKLGRKNMNISRIKLSVKVFFNIQVSKLDIRLQGVLVSDMNKDFEENK